MLSAIYTPKFAMFGKLTWLGCHVVCQRQLFANLYYGYKCFPALKKKKLKREKERALREDSLT